MTSIAIDSFVGRERTRTRADGRGDDDGVVICGGGGGGGGVGGGHHHHRGAIHHPLCVTKFERSELLF